MTNGEKNTGGSDWNWVDFFAYGSVAVGAVGAAVAVKAIYDAVTAKDVVDIRQTMKTLVVERAQRPDWRAGALRITTGAGVDPSDKIGQARTLHAAARRNLTYLSDPALPKAAFTSPPEVTLEVGGGDCKWLSTTLATLFVAHGLRTRFIFHPRANPTHALLMVNVPSEQFHAVPGPKAGLAEVDSNGSSAHDGVWMIVEPQLLPFGELDESTLDCVECRDFTDLDCVLSK